MCGFVGYIDKKVHDKNVIKEMSKMIVHRGPDDENYYCDDDISLAFRRLSIIDLKNGRQPMFNEDESIVITFNGEIYNYQELQEELKNKGYEFKTNSDTEVILHADTFMPGAIDRIQIPNSVINNFVNETNKE